MGKKMRNHWNQQMFEYSPLSIVTSSAFSYGNPMIFEGLTKSRLSELENSSCWLLSLEVSMPQHKLRWSDFPNSQEHNGGMSSGSTWDTNSISLHLWWRGVEDSINSRNHSPLDCLHDIWALGLYFLEACTPRYHSASREDATHRFWQKFPWSKPLKWISNCSWPFFLCFFLRSLWRPGRSKESHTVSFYTLDEPKGKPRLKCWEYQGQTLPPLLTFSVALGR